MSAQGFPCACKAGSFLLTLRRSSLLFRLQASFPCERALFLCRQSRSSGCVESRSRRKSAQLTEVCLAEYPWANIIQTAVCHFVVVVKNCDGWLWECV